MNSGGEEMYTWYGWLFVFLSYLHGILHIFHALMKSRTTQGTIAWVISLLWVPFFAMPLYWLLGRNKFMGYVRARRSNDQVLRGLAADMYQRLGQFGVDLPEENVFERAAEELGGLPFTRGNQLELLIDGKATFHRLFQEVERARETICVNFFIVKNDRIGREFQQLLIKKAQEGLKVYFLFDEIGSHKLTSKFLKELRDAGVECVSFGINRYWWSRLQWNFRNHRKIVVIDSEIAFIGGLNVGDEYLGRAEKFGAWRDTHLVLKGPAVDAVQLVFLEDWYWATKRVPQLSWKQEALHADQVIAIIPTGPADPVDSWQLLVAEAANTSRSRLWISSPYFVPDEGVLTALQLAALRGVDVKILIPDQADHLAVWYAAHSYYEQSIPFGIKILRYNQGFLHQKAMLVDDRMAAVGTANLDNRSFRLNFEITAFVSDSTFINQVEEMLKNDILGCREAKIEEYSEREVVFRIKCRLAKLFAPVL